MLDNLRSKHFELWLGGYLRQRVSSALLPKYDGLRHVLFAVCDHHEPLWQNPPVEQARARVQKWVDEYPRMASPFRDADGRPPQHTFFFPGEEYRPEFFDGLETLIRGGYGEIEYHLITKTRRRPVYAPRSKATWRASPAAVISPGRQPDRSDTRSSTGTGLSRTGGPTDGCAVWMPSSAAVLDRVLCRFHVPVGSGRFAAERRQPDYWPTGDLSRRRAYEYGQRARVGSHSRIGCCWSRGRSRSDCVHRARFRASNTGR